MPPVIRPPLVDVLDQHCEELGFLRVQRRVVPFSPDARLRHLARVEERIHAHKSALGLARRAATARARRQIARVELTTRDPFQWGAGMEIAVETCDGAELGYWSHFLGADAQYVDAFSEALRRMSASAFERFLRFRGPLADAPRTLEVVADAIGFRRGFAPNDDVPGADLPGVRRARARGLGLERDSDQRDVREALDALLDDPDALVRRAALWSTLLVDRSRAKHVARDRLSDPFALRVLGIAGEASDLETIAATLVDAKLRAAALEALGDLGHPRAGSLLREIALDDDASFETAKRALARLARPPPEDARDCDADTMKALVARLETIGFDGTRIVRGKPFDRVGAESSLESLWLAAVIDSASASHTVLGALRREIPSGLFAGRTTEDATPGDGLWSS